MEHVWEDIPRISATMDHGVAERVASAPRGPTGSNRVDWHPNHSALPSVLRMLEHDGPRLPSALVATRGDCPATAHLAVAGRMKAEANQAIEHLRNARGAYGYVPQATGAIMTEEDSEHVRWAVAAKVKQTQYNWRRKAKRKDKKKGLHDVSGTAPCRIHVIRRLQALFARFQLEHMLAQAIVSAQSRILDMAMASVDEAFRDWDGENRDWDGEEGEA